MAGAPTSGRVEAGKTQTRTYTDPTTGVSHTVTYQEPSVTLPAVDAQPGDPTTITIATTRYAGYSSQGALRSSRRIRRHATRRPGSQPRASAAS